MTDTQVKVAPQRTLLRKVLTRILSFLIFAFVAGTVVSIATRTSNNVPGPAGFGRGVLHGALMPAALPNLLLNRKVTIYARDNAGRSYDLGYTVGVNACGAIFFGISFWRVKRWRNRQKA